MELMQRNVRGVGQGEARDTETEAYSIKAFQMEGSGAVSVLLEQTQHETRTQCSVSPRCRGGACCSGRAGHLLLQVSRPK